MSEHDDLIGAGRSRRSPARYLAPIFLIAVIAGTYVVVHHGIAQINHTSSSTSAVGAPPRVKHAQKKYARAKFYLVQPGDTLTLISNKTGISVATLQALNRRINPNALQLGQRIRLRR